jgi:hypothetical integral membrane protein (TIGR02206 family)
MIDAIANLPLLAEPATVPLDPLIEFRPFTLFHVLTAGALLLLSVLCALVGRAWRGTEKEVFLGSFWGGFIIARQGIEVVWYLMPERFTIERSLPLQFCDVGPWIAAIALLTQKRWARAMLYYWGIGLCTQAFITPTLSEGLLHTRFWWFWLGHTHIIGASIYDIVARGYRPTWSDFRTMLKLSAVYTVFCVTLNAITGLNYGYLGPVQPGARTIIDVLGPYPWRILILMVIAFTTFFALTAIWRPAREGKPLTSSAS